MVVVVVVVVVVVANNYTPVSLVGCPLSVVCCLSALCHEQKTQNKHVHMLHHLQCSMQVRLIFQQPHCDVILAPAAVCSMLSRVLHDG